MALNDNAIVPRLTASTYLGITEGDATLDAETERLVNSASQIFARRCKRILYKATHTQYLDGSRTNKIILQQWPITGGPADGATKPEVSIDQKSEFAASAALDVDEYYVSDDSTTIVRVKGSFPKGTRNIKVIYEAGYGNHAADDFPADLQEACLQFIQYLNQKHHDRRLGIVTKGKSSENVTYELGIPSFIDAMLEPYIRHDFYASNAPVTNG